MSPREAAATIEAAAARHACVTSATDIGHAAVMLSWASRRACRHVRLNGAGLRELREVAGIRAGRAVRLANLLAELDLVNVVPSGGGLRVEPKT